MAYGECHEGNKTNRMMRLEETEVGNFRQLWSEKSLLRKWYLSQDLKDGNEHSIQKSWGKHLRKRNLWGAERKPTCLKYMKWVKVKEKSSMAPWPGKKFGCYSLQEFSINICYWLLNEIICKCIFILCTWSIWTGRRSSAIGVFSLLGC